jgi:hypothetical protein
MLREVQKVAVEDCEVHLGLRSCVAARTLVGFAQRENGKPAEVRYPQLRLLVGVMIRSARLPGVFMNIPFDLPAESMVGRSCADDAC